MNWEKLTFSYTKTNTIIVSHYKNGEWGPLESRRDDNISISALSASLHYGIQAFEGLKAYRGKDEKIRLFRPYENAKRLRRSADYLGIASPDQDMFVEACKRVVLENIEFLPPYEYRASMYIRPFVIGVGAQIDLVSPNEVLFIVAAIPIGSFAGSINRPAKVLLAQDHDRAAPMGTGSYKLGGNYAAAIVAGVNAKKEGYSSVLYLDSSKREYIDEFSSSNFFAIKGNSYITPDSESVLPSITNNSLMQLAKDDGMSIERRRIKLEELETFEEVGACGTAIVILPVSRIDDKLNNKSYMIGDPVTTGKMCLFLYKKLTGIQFGEEKDIHNWCLAVEK
ncbi:MAG: branched-chain-amino-acid transaminase [Bacteroidetes bacterium GWF2_41_61]|nr:MAG: branched-chain-amino-acid transaminase [Bacteroidetes bacterium GWE2_40_15]OFY27999.1 MAG: branched-chain-amino-acid transaminase [Bacteroidetes bacterium GWF2_41_61]OFY88917.1 MAG: branched-chain-amino-acid transaminase [Bacteroidetes bacterium RIFOXYA12_FULL_40_10]